MFLPLPDVDDLALLRCIRNVLELALVRYLEVLEIGGVVIVDIRIDGYDLVVVLTALDLGDRLSYVVECQGHAILIYRGDRFKAN